MVIKTINGEFLREEEINNVAESKHIELEDIVIISNFFKEEFFGVFDRDTYSLVNTNLRCNFSNVI